MKTYSIEVQRVTAMSNDRGTINARIDAIVQPVSPRRSQDDSDEQAHTLISMNEDTARVLMLLLKAQLAEFDKRKAKSRF